MNRNVIAIVVFVAAGALVFPTVASPFADSASEPDVIEIAPSDGPNSVYAVEDGDGQLAIEITERNQALAEPHGDGVNDQAVTVISNIFTITNQAEGSLRVWIETDVDDIEFVRGTDSLSSIDGSANSVTVTDGETIHVGVRIDAVGNHDVRAIDSFEVVTEPVDPDEDESRDGNDEDDGDQQERQDDEPDNQENGDDEGDGGDDGNGGQGDGGGPGGRGVDAGDEQTRIGDPAEQTDEGSSVGGLTGGPETPSKTLVGALLETIVLLLLALLAGVFLFWAARRGRDVQT